MIKLQRSPPPSYLCAERITELTNEFKNNGKAVWNNEYIKKQLLFSSNWKCAYCECSLKTESNYMEVEHFENKKINPDKVVAWENLLPSCKKCNNSKGTHDVLATPIINPYLDNPRDHLEFRLYRLRGTTELGACTIDVVKLNQSDRLVHCRYEIGEKIATLVETSVDRFNCYLKAKTTRAKNRLEGIVEGLLIECTPAANYAASTATILLNNDEFLDLISKMRNEQIWNSELEKYLQEALLLVLPYK